MTHCQKHNNKITSASTKNSFANCIKLLSNILPVAPANKIFEIITLSFNVGISNSKSNPRFSGKLKAGQINRAKKYPTKNVRWLFFPNFSTTFWVMLEQTWSISCERRGRERQRWERKKRKMDLMRGAFSEGSMGLICLVSFCRSQSTSHPHSPDSGWFDPKETPPLALVKARTSDNLILINYSISVSIYLSSPESVKNGKINFSK